MGAANAIRVDAPSRDAFFVSRQIASVAEKEGYDFILCGRESIDYNGAQVGHMISEWMKVPSVYAVKKININEGKDLLEREREGGREIDETYMRSEERRVGKESVRRWSDRWWREEPKKKKNMKRDQMKA